MLYAVVSQNFANRTGNVREKWYQTEYKMNDLDKVFVKKKN